MDHRASPQPDQSPIQAPRALTASQAAMVMLLCVAAVGWTGQAVAMASVTHTSAPLHEARDLTGAVVRTVKRIVRGEEGSGAVERTVLVVRTASVEPHAPAVIAQSSLAPGAGLVRVELLDLPPPATA